MQAPPLLRVTVDTNVLPLDVLRAQIGEAPVDIVVTSVTAREVEGASVATEVAALPAVPETAVWMESRVGPAVWGSAEQRALRESVLREMSNGSFPKPGARSSLTRGQQHQLRDAMIPVAHVREGRDVLVTDDKDFGADDSEDRRRICDLAATRIISTKQFVALCATFRRTA